MKSLVINCELKLDDSLADKLCNQFNLTGNDKTIHANINLLKYIQQVLVNAESTMNYDKLNDKFSLFDLGLTEALERLVNIENLVKEIVNVPEPDIIITSNKSNCIILGDVESSVTSKDQSVEIPVQPIVQEVEPVKETVVLEIKAETVEEPKQESVPVTLDTLFSTIPPTVNTNKVRDRLSRLTGGKALS